MRVIAVGDDDQNIYEFRGSDSGYMYRLAQESGSTFVEMTENYRSARQPVDFANGFLRNIHKDKKYTNYLHEKRRGLGRSNTLSIGSICISHSLKTYFNIGTKALRVYSPKQTKRLLS